MTTVAEPPVATDDSLGEPAPAQRSSVRVRWWQSPETRSTVQLIVTIAVVAGSALYVLAHLSPRLIFTDSTPTGGDFGAHVWGPAFLRDHLLAHGKLSGWAPDWYGGLPAYRFYMVVPALFVTALDSFLAYGVAMKVVSALGLVLFPVACWAFGRLSAFEFPIPQLFAIAGVFFVFDETFTIYGGNAASTMAGEFSFSLALTVGMVYLGLFSRGMRTGRNRALAAFVLALAALCHLIVAIYLVVATIIMFVLYADRKRLRYLLTMAPVAALLTAFWTVPFYLAGPYMTDMFYDRRPYGNAPNDQPDSYWQMLFPHGQWIDLTLAAFALIALVASVVKGRRMGVFLGLSALVFGTWAVIWPQSHLWNARLLPFLYLMRFLLVALGIAELAAHLHRSVTLGARERALQATSVEGVERETARAVRLNDPGAAWRTGLAVLVACTLGALVVLGMRFQNMPGGKFVNRGGASVYVWGPFESKKGQFVDDWARWNYSGYEAKPHWGEYRGVLQTMKDVGAERGCGRALWEHNPGSYGTPMALMLLPFWTDGCIGSMEGLYFEASATTPYHFLSAAALSEKASNPVRRLTYTDNDVALGVRYLQDLGVRYYLAYNPSVVEQADQQPELTPIAQSGPWHVYEVAETDLVVPLAEQPVVVTGREPGFLFGMGESRDRWLEVGVSWFQHPEDWGALPAADGPEGWQRVDVEAVEGTETTSETLARVQPVGGVTPTSLPPVTVSDVERGEGTITFSVDQIGVPVLVRESYFPNWEVEGAAGPYRVAPNYMVVVPTQQQVTLRYETSATDWLSYVLTLVGLVGLVVLWRRGPVEYDDEPAPALVPVGASSRFGPGGDADLTGDPTPPGGVVRPVGVPVVDVGDLPKVGDPFAEPPHGAPIPLDAPQPDGDEPHVDEVVATHGLVDPVEGNTEADDTAPDGLGDAPAPPADEAEVHDEAAVADEGRMAAEPAVELDDTAPGGVEPDGTALAEPPAEPPAERPAEGDRPPSLG